MTSVSSNRQLKVPFDSSTDNITETRSSGHLGATPSTLDGERGSLANEAPASQVVEKAVPPSQIIPDNDILEVDPSYCNGDDDNKLSIENDNAKTPPPIDTIDREGDNTHPAKRQKTEEDGDNDGLGSLSEIGVGESAEDPKGPHHSCPGKGVEVVTTPLPSNGQKLVISIDSINHNYRIRLDIMDHETGVTVKATTQRELGDGDSFDLRTETSRWLKPPPLPANAGDAPELPPLPVVKIEEVGEAPNATSNSDELKDNGSTTTTTMERNGSQVEGGLPKVLEDPQMVEGTAATNNLKRKVID